MPLIRLPYLFIHRIALLSALWGLSGCCLGSVAQPMSAPQTPSAPAPNEVHHGAGDIDPSTLPFPDLAPGTMRLLASGALSRDALYQDLNAQDSTLEASAPHQTYAYFAGTSDRLATRLPSARVGVMTTGVDEPERPRVDVQLSTDDGSIVSARLREGHLWLEDVDVNTGHVRYRFVGTLDAADTGLDGDVQVRGGVDVVLTILR